MNKEELWNNFHKAFIIYNDILYYVPKNEQKEIQFKIDELSEIRHKLSNLPDADLHLMVPDSVLSYINEQKLYDKV